MNDGSTHNLMNGGASSTRLRHAKIDETLRLERIERLERKSKSKIAVHAPTPTPAPLLDAPAPLLDAPARDARPAKAPRVDTVKLNKLIVSAYKLMGFAILAVILCGLASYIATHVFFYVSTSWVEPMVLSPSDPRVLAVTSQFAQESGHRDALVGQKLQLEARLHDAQRIAETEQRFQDAFRGAMQADLSDRKAQLTRFGGLQGRYSVTRREIAQNSRAFSDVSKERIAGEYQAHVIDRDQMVAGQFQLSQVAGADLSLAEKNLELDQRVQALKREADSLEVVTAGDARARVGKVTYEVLRIAHEFDRSVLDRQRALDDAKALDESIAQLAKTIGVYDALLHGIEGSPFMLASGKTETLAFVPYDNARAATAGAKVYACRVGFVVCRKVGTIAKVLDGETEGKHPLFNKDMRGTTVVLHLDDRAAAAQAVLHVGRAPLFL